MAEVKFDLVRQWTHDGDDYRLLSRKTYVSYNYVDEFLVEVDEKDSLGAPKWVPVYSWTSASESNSHGALTALVELVRADTRLLKAT